MKKIIFILSLFTLISCSKSRNFKLVVASGEGFTYSETWIYCDSFTMISEKEAEIIVDGKKSKILATRFIRPASE
jgi:hypothetical protein